MSHNSEWSATDIARHIRAVSETDFDAALKQFKDWGGKYILPPGGCVQFLMAAMNVRRDAIFGHFNLKSFFSDRASSGGRGLNESGQISGEDPDPVIFTFPVLF